jgi:hypothetical protein
MKKYQGTTWHEGVCVVLLSLQETAFVYAEEQFTFFNRRKLSNESTKQMQQLITGLLLVVQIQLNMFRASLCPSSGAHQLQQQPLVLPLERGGSSAVGRGRAGRPDHEQQHCYHHVPTVNQKLLLQLMGS